MSEKEEIKETNEALADDKTKDQAEDKIENEVEQNEAENEGINEADAEEPQDETEQMKKNIAELQDKNLRLYAEFENFKKRTARERIELFGSANQELMNALLPVLDDFQRAIKAEEDETASEGIKLIYNKFENTLKNKGLKAMEDTTGKDFDADTMEAVTQIPTPDKKMKGKVMDELERGYFLGNKILRYAKVVVGQ